MRVIDDTFQADLIEVIPYAKINNGYKYILCNRYISKYSWAFPLKNKTGKEVTSYMKKLFDNEKRIPKNLQTEEKNFTITTSVN